MKASNTQIGRRSKRFVYSMLVALVSLCLWNSPAIAAESPQAVIQKGTDQVLNILRRYPEASSVRTKQVEAVIDRYFDFRAMARLAVGPQWNRVPPAIQQEFTNEFKRLLFATYIGDIEKYSEQGISYFTGSLTSDYALVEGSIYNNGSPIYLDYSLRLKNGSWKVYDVAVSGVSLAINYREQFNNFLATRSFNDLVAALRSKTDRLCRLGRC